MADSQLLSLIRIRLENISGSRHIEKPEPGLIRTEQTVELSSNDEIDREHPGVLRLTMRLKGEQKKGEAEGGENKKPRDSAKRDAGSDDGVIAFELEATVVAVFAPRDGGRMSQDEFTRSIDSMILQTYPYVREWLTGTLDKMGVRSALPLSPAFSGAASIA